MTPEPSRTRTVPRNRFALLDCLRLIAALSVVAYHWFFWGPQHNAVTSVAETPFAPIAAYGILGVPLFFLISGFVIFLSASGRSAGQFLAGRASRLFPAFWGGLVLATGTLMVTGEKSFLEVIPQFAANATMVPKAFGQPMIDGVYWTLLLELQFYALVFLFLALGLRRWLEAFFPLWAIGMAATTFLLPSVAGLPLIGGLFSLFAGGAIIGIVSRKGWSLLRAIGLAASIAASIPSTQELAAASEVGDIVTDPLTMGVLVVALFALVFAVTGGSAARLRVPGSRAAGALTYPIYLCHAVFGYALLNAIGTPETTAHAYFVMFVIVVAVSFGVHYGIERTGAALWQRFFAVSIEIPVTAILRRLGRQEGYHAEMTVSS